MCVKAIQINEQSSEFCFRLLAAMFPNGESPQQVSFSRLAARLGVSEEVVRYNVRKLQKCGYIVSYGVDVGYALTGKVLIFNKEENKNE